MADRYDAQVPDSSTALRSLLDKEHLKSGIPKSRLLVQFAASWAEMLAGASTPLLIPTQAVAPVVTNGNGHSEAGIEQVNDLEVASFYLDD